jgi:DNA polymerase III epsilon subunit-like protein
LLDEQNCFHHVFVAPQDIFVQEALICASLIESVQKYGQIVTHGGRKFDVPMVVTRSLLHGLNPSPLLKANMVDTLEIAWNVLCLKHNRLEDLARFLKIPKKTELNGADMPMLS